MEEELEVKNDSRLKKAIAYLRKSEGVSWAMIVILSIFVTLPLYVILYQYVPAVRVGNFRVDSLLTFIPLFVIVIYIIYRFRILVYVAGASIMVWIMILSISGTYSFKNLYFDYQSMIYALENGAVRIDFLEKDEEFTNQDLIVMAIDYRSRSVRNYAVEAATTHFLEFSENDLGPGRTVIQSFSIFRELQRRWVYVHDPQFEDYYASASETVMHVLNDGKFKGDCDDYSILMAACIKAIGGEVRLVRTKIIMEDSTEIGHIYPEVMIGDEKDLEASTYLIKKELFPTWAKNKDIFYHEDKNGDIWLNFDYNDEYPGGKYQSKIRISEIEI